MPVAAAVQPPTRVLASAPARPSSLLAPRHPLPPEIPSSRNSRISLPIHHPYDRSIDRRQHIRESKLSSNLSNTPNPILLQETDAVPPRFTPTRRAERADSHLQRSFVEPADLPTLRLSPRKTSPQTLHRQNHFVHRSLTPARCGNRFETTFIDDRDRPTPFQRVLIITSTRLRRHVPGRQAGLRCLPSSKGQM